MKQTAFPSNPVVAGDFAAVDAPGNASAHPVNPVDRAIESRQSMREFLPTPVPRATLAHLLELASRAPSGTNTQPWKAYVLQGTSRDTLVDKVCQAHDALRAEAGKKHASV